VRGRYHIAFECSLSLFSSFIFCATRPDKSSPLCSSQHHLLSIASVAWPFLVYSSFVFISVYQVTTVPARSPHPGLLLPPPSSIATVEDNTSENQSQTQEGGEAAKQ
jgi:hypothetical protein